MHRTRRVGYYLWAKMDWPSVCIWFDCCCFASRHFPGLKWRWRRWWCWWWRRWRCGGEFGLCKYCKWWIYDSIWFVKLLIFTLFPLLSVSAPIQHSHFSFIGSIIHSTEKVFNKRTSKRTKANENQPGSWIAINTITLRVLFGSFFLSPHRALFGSI